MKKCSNCNSILEEDAKFCTVCGMTVPEDQSSSLNNSQAQPINDDSIQVVDTSKTEEATGKNKAKKLSKVFITLAIVMFVVAFVLLASLCVTLGVVKFGSKKTKEYCFYLKDNSLYTVEGKKSFGELTTKYYANEDDADYLSGGFYRNGNNILFTDKNEYNGYYIIEGNLVQADLNEKTDNNKIDSNVNSDSIYVNENFSKYVYLKDDTWYSYNVKKGEKEKIGDSFWSLKVSKDLNNFVYIDDDDRLYVKFGNSDKTKISDDVDEVYTTGDDFDKNSTFFYVQYDDVAYENSLWSYQKEEKKELLEGDDIYVRTFESGKAYFIVYDDDDDEYDIYYYDGKTAAFAGTAPYTSYDKTAYFTASNKGEAVAVYLDEDDEYHALIEKKDIPLTTIEEDYLINYIVFSEDGTKMLVRTVKEGSSSIYENTCYFYSVENKGTNASLKLEKTIYDVRNAYFMPDNTIVYIQDYDAKDGTGSLYVGDTFVSADVYYIVSNFVDVKNKVYYATDLSSSDNSYSLYVYSGNKKKLVSTDVSYTSVLEDGSIYYMYDYSNKHDCGDLYYYNGKKPVKIDSEVAYFVLSETND